MEMIKCEESSFLTVPGTVPVTCVIHTMHWSILEPTANSQAKPHNKRMYNSSHAKVIWFYIHNRSPSDIGVFGHINVI